MQKNEVKPYRRAVYFNKTKDKELIDYINTLDNFSDWVKERIKQQLTPQPKPIDNMELIRIIEQIIESKLQGKVITEQKPEEVKESVKDVLSELDDYF